MSDEFMEELIEFANSEVQALDPETIDIESFSFDGNIQGTRIDFRTLELQTKGMFDIQLSLPNDFVPKGKVHLVVPETHIKDTNLPARKDYVAEMKDIFSAVEHVVQLYNPEKTIFMGEIFDRGFKTVAGSCYWFHTLLSLCQFTEVCCVKGNHEDSFYHDNPIWYLGNGAGMHGIGTVTFPENFISEGVAFNFQHYNRKFQPIQGSKSILFSHRDIMTQQIRDLLEKQTGENIWWTKNTQGVITSELFPEYDAVFNGHMHKLCAMLRIKRKYVESLLTLVYTSTLGRTNITEVNDNSLWKYMYLIDCFDGDFEIIPVGIRLPSYEECVVEEERTKKIKKNIENKALKVVRKETLKGASPDVLLKYQSPTIRRFYTYSTKHHPLTILQSIDNVYNKEIERCQKKILI